MTMFAVTVRRLVLVISVGAVVPHLACSSGRTDIPDRARRQKHEIRVSISGESRLVHCGVTESAHRKGDGIACHIDLLAEIPAEVGPALTPADLELQTVFAAVKPELIESDWVVMRGCGKDRTGTPISYVTIWSRRDGWLKEARGWGGPCSSEQ